MIFSLQMLKSSFIAQEAVSSGKTAFTIITFAVNYLNVECVGNIHINYILLKQERGLKVSTPIS